MVATNCSRSPLRVFRIDGLERFASTSSSPLHLLGTRELGFGDDGSQDGFKGCRSRHSHNKSLHIAVPAARDTALRRSVVALETCLLRWDRQGSLARSVGRRTRPRVYCASPTEWFTSKMDALSAKSATVRRSKKTKAIAQSMITPKSMDPFE
jgi:hypothetical protein